MKSIFKILLFIVFVSCRENIAENSMVDTKEVSITKVDSDTTTYSNQSLDSIILCNNYAYMYGYFSIPDYGCIYKPETINKIGNVEVYLVPKNKINITEYEKEEDKLNSLSINEIKSQYKIVVFVIDKKFLSYNKNADVIYYPNFPYTQCIYTYSTQWDKIETLHIINEKDSLYGKIKEKLLNTDLIDNETMGIEGRFHIKTTVLSVESGEPVEVKFYLKINRSEAILSIGSNNGMEAYCEGAYKIEKNADILKLIYNDEGICTSDSDESSIYIKKTKEFFYIKSKRFYEDSWNILEKD